MLFEKFSLYQNYNCFISIHQVFLLDLDSIPNSNLGVQFRLSFSKQHFHCCVSGIMALSVYVSHTNPLPYDIIALSIYVSNTNPHP